MFKTTRLLLIAVIIQIIVFSGLSILLYKNFRLVNNGDVAIINQVFWTTVHGRFFEGTLLSHYAYSLGSYNYFSSHFEAINLLILPLYALLPRPESLIFIKSLFLALAAIPLYLIAKDKLGDRPALIICFAYLLSPVVALQMFYIIQAEVYAALFIPLAFYFFEKEKFKLFILSILLLALIKESMPLYIVIFGVYAWLKRRPWKWSLPFIIGGPVYFIAVVYLVMPGLTNYAAANPSYLWASKVLPAFSISGIFELIKQMFSSSQLASLVSYLLPFGLIFPWLSPVALFIISDAFLKLGFLGTEYGIRHYAVILNTFIFISLIYFLNSVAIFYNKRKGPQNTQRRIVYFCLALFISMAWRGKGFLNPANYTRRPNYQAQREVINFIPADASVSAPKLLTPYLSNRFQVGWIGPGDKYNDINRAYDYLILDTTGTHSHQSEIKRTQELLRIMPGRSDYRLVFKKEGFLIYQKIKPD